MIGRYDAGRPGPTLIIIGGLHGNEPMGLIAAERIFAWLEEARPPLRGRVIGLRGHRLALARGVRLVDADLNRAFRYERRPELALVPTLAETDAERVELEELITALREAVAEADPGFETITLDLHTFSADGPPFVSYADTLRNRRFARVWPLANILGLTEELHGTLADYLAVAGCVSCIIETGRHDDPAAADRHAAALRLALVAAGQLDAADVPSLDADRALLAEAARGTPPVLDVQHRHPVSPSDGFRMRPGFSNFQPIAVGAELADDATGPVTAVRRGRVFLPLYQPQGEDGFFIVRRIGRFWLHLSGVLRRTGLSRIARWLPAVRPHPEEPEAVIVDTRVARFLTDDVMHLLGYRRLRRHGDRRVYARHPYDLRRPARPEV